MIRIQSAIALLFISLFNLSCIPKPTVEGEMVAVKSPLDIMQCKHLGNSNIILSKLQSIMMLDAKQLDQALAINARNFAGRIGADTVVADKKSEKSSQIFRFYICDANRNDS